MRFDSYVVTPPLNCSMNCESFLGSLFIKFNRNKKKVCITYIHWVVLCFVLLWLYHHFLWIHLIHLPIFFRVSLLALEQYHDYPGVSDELEKMGLKLPITWPQPNTTKQKPCAQFLECTVTTWVLFQYKDCLFRYRDFHYKDEAFVTLFYLYCGNSYTSETVLYIEMASWLYDTIRSHLYDIDNSHGWYMGMKQVVWYGL